MLLGYFEEKQMFKNHLEPLPDCQNAFAQSVSFLLCIYRSSDDYEHDYYMAVGGRGSLRMSIMNQSYEDLKVIFLTETK